MSVGWSGPGPDVLTDRQALLAGDRYALVLAVATAGAQVRAVAEQLAGARFDRPRSLIVVDPAGTGDGAHLSALLPRARVPVVTGPRLPGWAGPLDLAVVLAAAVDDRPAAESAAEATRRGVRLVVRGAAHGPVAAAAGAALVAPRLAVPELAAGPGRLALLLAVAAAADLAPDETAGRASGSGAAEPERERGSAVTGPPAAAPTAGPGATDEGGDDEGGSAVLTRIADALDAEALACGPAAEPFVNPALLLAQRVADGAALFIADDPAGFALARRCARAVRLLGGRPAGAQHAAGLLPGGQLMARLARVPDPFADPELDGPAGLDAVPVLIPPCRPADDIDGRMAALGRALPRAVQLLPDEPDLSPAAVAAVLALRVDFAAAYLGIAAGQVAPADGPDGLGPSGGARDVRPATTVEDVTRDDWGERGGRPWS